MMNVRCGLIRLWIVASVMWAIAALIYGYRHCSFDTFPDTSGGFCWWAVQDEPSWSWWESTFGFVSWPKLIGWIIAVPLLALAMGFTASWVISWFRRQSPGGRRGLPP
jgi:hypothetical protein